MVRLWWNYRAVRSVNRPIRFLALCAPIPPKIVEPTLCFEEDAVFVEDEDDYRPDAKERYMPFRRINPTQFNLQGVSPLDELADHCEIVAPPFSFTPRLICAAAVDDPPEV